MIFGYNYNAKSDIIGFQIIEDASYTLLRDPSNGEQYPRLKLYILLLLSTKANQGGSNESIGTKRDLSYKRHNYFSG